MTQPRALYNEIDENAAAWLRELIRQGHIAPGDVVTTSIEDLTPNDVRGYTQVHFFAGIGVWSYALRRAGWPDDRPVWTGSCPCQPFSSAGKGNGFDDERHLWPSWYWLIDQCRPAIVFGEQVASKDAEPWLDLVQADLEALAYSVGAVPFPSAGIGAPHIRDRLYWVADAEGAGARRQSRCLPITSSTGEGEVAGQRHGDAVGTDRAALRLDLAGGEGLEGQRRGYQAEVGQWQGSVRPVAQAGEFGGLADSNSDGCEPRSERQSSLGYGATAKPDRGNGGMADADGGNTGPEREQSSGQQRQQQEDSRLRELEWHLAYGPGTGIDDRLCDVSVWPCPTNGLWRDADWLFCRDGKWRPVEPGTFPLAHGAPARVGRLRGYGNAINAEAAAAFVKSCVEAIGGYSDAA